MFKKNVGGIDRLLRIVVGVGLLALFFLFPEEPWRMWTLIGVVPLATGLMGSCALYSIIGINTCPNK
ncbi:MAG TPA: DUF2892 domain-containing protein [Rhodospirillaceae bacterium]|nr:DUF2892 domain-containing protein [Rhodospirillaceae bacterium]